EDLARPVDGRAQRLVHVARSLDHRLVVIASDYERAFGGIAGDDLDDLLRIGAIAHEIAEERVARRTACGGVLEAGLERFQVAVHVGEERDDHARVEDFAGVGTLPYSGRRFQSAAAVSGSRAPVIQSERSPRALR